MQARVVVTAALCAAAAYSGGARAQEQAKIDPQLITQADALAVAQAAIASCKARGMSVNVQVADADGNLRLALASEDATLAGLRTAPQKIASVLAFHMSTRELKARVDNDPAFAAQYGKDPRYHFSPGGLALYKAGKFVAVLAVGGGRTIDEECALDALKLLPWASTRG